MIDSILTCLCGGVDTSSSRPLRDKKYAYHLIDEKPASTPQPSFPDGQARTTEEQSSGEEAAAKIVAVLRTTKNTGAELRAELEGRGGPVSAAGWSEWLAENMFHSLRSMLGDRLDGGDTQWAVALTDAYHAARTTAEDHLSSFLEYAREHPGEVAAEVAIEVLLSLVAFGILVRMTRWVVTLLGFGELGPVAGSFAARWEARYAGHIPKGSLFSYIQRMGMTWK